MASTHSYLLFFSNRGRLLGEGSRAAASRAHGARQGDRQPAAPVAAGAHHEHVPVRDFNEEGYLVMATRKGVIKRCDLSDSATRVAAHHRHRPARRRRLGRRGADPRHQESCSPSAP